MAVLKSQKRELFAQGLAKGLSARKAAESAGFSERSAPYQASRLQRNATVANRVAELQREIAIGLKNGPQVVESDYDRRFVRAAICDRAWRVTQLQAMFDELREPKARLNRDKTIRTQSYEAAAAILKQAAQELGQWEEKQSHRTEEPEYYSQYANMTVEQLYAEQARLLGESAKEKAKTEKKAKPKANTKTFKKTASQNLLKSGPPLVAGPLFRAPSYPT